MFNEILWRLLLLMVYGLLHLLFLWVLNDLNLLTTIASTFSCLLSSTSYYFRLLCSLLTEAAWTSSLYFFNSSSSFAIQVSFEDYCSSSYWILLFCSSTLSCKHISDWNSLITSFISCMSLLSSRILLSIWFLSNLRYFTSLCAVCSLAESRLTCCLWRS